MKTHRSLFVSVYLLIAGVAAASHPMQGDCKGANPDVCELVESDILPKQGHQGTHPAIHMSIKKKNTLHVVHTGGKDFHLDVNQLHPPGEPASCKNVPNPFSKPMPFDTDTSSHVKEFVSTPPKKAAKGCTYELWMTEHGSGLNGDPHMFIDQ